MVFQPLFLKLAIRNIRKFWGITVINVLGLIIGLTCTTLIFIFVYDEYSFDRFHENKDKIYRLGWNIKTPSETTYLAPTPGPLGPALINDFPQVEKMVRFTPARLNITFRNNSFGNLKSFSADPGVFEIFSFDLIMGSQGQVLSNPSSIVLSEEIAQRIFGNENPIGKRLELPDLTNELTVTGVFKNLPRNSHIQFDVLTSMDVHYELSGWDDGTDWYTNIYYTYLQLTDPSFADELEQQLPFLINRYIDNEVSVTGIEYSGSLVPLSQLYLNSDRRYEIGPTSDKRLLFFFSVAGLFVLLIACVNYITLSTARSIKRYKEIGIHKTLGADKSQLFGQFIGESVGIILSSLLAVYVLTVLLLPSANSFSGKTIAPSFLWSAEFLLAFISGGLLIGILSGLYPAFVLSNFQTANILKASQPKGISGSLVRKILTGFQLFISLFLIISSLVIYQQTNFMLYGETGFTKSDMMVVAISEDVLGSKVESFEQELLNHPDVVKATISDRYPGEQTNRTQATIRLDNGERLISNIDTYFVGYNFFDTYGIELIAGTPFSPALRSDSLFNIIINRSSLRLLQIESGRPDLALERIITVFGADGFVQGVTEDFHFRPFTEQIEPIALILLPEAFSFISLKLNAQFNAETIDGLEKIWKKFAPGHDFNYFFLEDKLSQNYTSQSKLKQVIFAFSFLAILISCLGLLGLTSFTAKQKSSEIAVRKVLGASYFEIIQLIWKELLLLILLASVFAIPASWIFLTEWLDNFAYKVEHGVAPYVFGVLAILILSVLVTSYHSLKAAMVNPTDYLRSE
jgi:putative ABC transport system permease protein